MIMFSVANYRSLILFGMLLALLATLLEFIEYRYFIGSLDTAVYTSMLAVVFTSIGIWIGVSLWGSTNRHPGKTKLLDRSKIGELKLNHREYEILELIAKGHSNQQIADLLFLAVPTVKTHTSNLYSKLNVRSRTQAVHKARVLHLI